ncbi:MAG TPA: glycosyltransferase [Thermoanaerobaculia bacterium]|nr:glycosyltransferase [Thermoanaerobaculia bacterium]
MTEVKLLDRGRPVAGVSGGRPRVSIILPVKNGENDLPHLLEAIAAQTTDAEVELVAIDSGSVDRTVDMLRDAGATVLSIAAEAFDYGLTRNLATAHASGEILIFVTLRARPAGTGWLANLIAPLRDDSPVAATFSCVLPRPDADLLAARDQLRARSPVRELRSASSAAIAALDGPALRQLVSFHNVSCAVRASVFSRVPFRQSTYGEDMRWAREILEGGHAVQYEPSSVVFHSHDYSWEETLYRGYDDGRGHREAIDLRFGASELAAATVSMVLDDWRYLARGWRMSGEELRNGVLASLGKRSAWSVGRWLGSNDDRFGDDLESLGTFIESDSRGSGLEAYASAFGTHAGNRPGVVDAGASLEDLLPRVIDSPDEDIVREALLRLAAEAGRLVAGKARALEGRLRSQLSLIARIRSGVKTVEMGREGSRCAVRYFRDEGNPWSEPFRPAVTALQVEHSLMFEKATEAGAWAQSIHAGLLERDAIIRELQEQLHAKVGERDELIRSLQRELHEKVGEANAIIAGLQDRLAGR